MKVYIYPYSSASESAKLLANRLGAKRIKLQNSEYKHSPDNLVINWGNSNCPYPCLNEGAKLRETVDKLRLFRLMTQKGYHGYLPNYWTNPADIPDTAFPVMCRTTTTGCDGEGIVIALSRNDLVPASLYTQYIEGGTEYRVTYFRGEITDIQTKLPRIGENPDPFVKTFSNGWGFQRKAIDTFVANSLPEFAGIIANATGLDFFGADIIRAEGRYYLLEVNSAMGLEGDALERFATAVEAYVKELEEDEIVANDPILNDYYEIPEYTINEDPIIGHIRGEDWLQVIRIAAERI